MNIKENLQVLMESTALDFDQCLMAVKLICAAEAEEQPQLMAYFLQHNPHLSAEDAEYAVPQPSAAEAVEALMEKYHDAVEDRADEVLKKYWRCDGAHPQHLYEELWRCVTDLEEPALRAMALLVLTEDVRLTVEFDKALRMPQDEYEAAIEALGDDANSNLLLLMVTPWQQKTERASMLLQLLDKYEDPKLRTVLMTRIIAHYELMARMEKRRRDFGAAD